MFGRWIPVSEGLPKYRMHECGEPVEFIVMIKGAQIPTVLSIDMNDRWFSVESFEYGNLIHYDVIAWQPLPEPYREGM